jgi:hypothetical protein
MHFFLHLVSAIQKETVLDFNSTAAVSRKAIAQFDVFVFNVSATAFHLKLPNVPVVARERRRAAPVPRRSRTGGYVPFTARIS